jgi:hypothetical protein
MAIGIPPAQMGFVGFVQFEIARPAGLIASGNNLYVVRAKSCDLNLKQAMTKQNTISGLFDRMVYQPQPELIEGNVEYCVSMADAADKRDPTPLLWDLAANRNYWDKLDTFSVAVKYAQLYSGFRYIDCVANTFSFSVKEQGFISVNVGLMAYDREETNFGTRAITVGILNNSNVHIGRLANWKDAIVNLYAPEFTVSGDYIRSFQVSLANNCERYFTGSGPRLLKVLDISPKPREIEGSVTIMGRHQYLAAHAANAYRHCREMGAVEFGYDIDCLACETNVCLGERASFRGRIPNVVYLIEELQLTGDVFETVIKFNSLPADSLLTTYSRTS